MQHIFKPRFIVGAFLCLLTVTSCKKDINSISFDLNYSAAFTIPASTILITTPISIPTPDINTNSTEEFKNHNISADKVKQITLNALKLSVTSPDGKTFSFLKSIHLYISSPNVAEVEVGYLDNVPADRVINLTPTSANLAPYIKADSFKLRSEFVTDETNPEVQVKADMNMTVTTKIL